jgi:hypothetical protein
MRSDNLRPLSPQNLDLLRAWAAGNALEVVMQEGLAVIGPPHATYVFPIEDGYQRVNAAKVSQAFTKQNQEQGKT